MKIVKLHNIKCGIICGLRNPKTVVRRFLCNQIQSQNPIYLKALIFRKQSWKAGFPTQQSECLSIGIRHC